MTPEERIEDWKRSRVNADGEWEGPPSDWDLHTPGRSNGSHKAPEAALSIKSVCLAGVKIERPDWLWENRIARGSVVILEGIEGLGKSTLLCSLAGAVTRGQGLPDMHFNGPENVLWFTAEESLSVTIKPRMMAAGADCNRVFCIDEAFTLDDAGIALLMREIDQHKPALVVIDPIFAYVKGDPSKGLDARGLTNQFKKIVEAFGCVIIMVRHLGKSKGMGDPRAAGLNSIEWRAAARSVLLAGNDPDDERKCALVQTKNNLGPKAPAIGFVIENDPGSPSGARFSWTGLSDLTPKRILEMAGTEDDRSERHDAEDFLREMLGHGERTAAEIMAEANRCSISHATLRRAKANLKVVSRLEGYGKKGTWYWSMPEDWELPALSQAQNRDAQASKNEHLLLSDSNTDTCEEKHQRDAHLNMSVGQNGHKTSASEHLFDKNSEKSNAGNEIARDAQNSDSNNLFPTDETKKSSSNDENITPADWKSPFDEPIEEIKKMLKKQDF